MMANLERDCPPVALPPPAPGQRLIQPIRLGGGLFNQLWTLQGLIAYAKGMNQSLIMPTFDSTLHPRAMGVLQTPTNMPEPLPFARLFSYDCLASALLEHGVIAYEHSPPGAKLLKRTPPSEPLLKRYQRYLGQRLRGEVAANPLEDVVYRNLRPSLRLQEEVRRWLASSGAERGGGYGCLHARVENDMRRWWYHVGKVRPLSLAQILELMGGVDAIRRTPKLFVAVGVDIRPSDEQLLLSQRTPWSSTMLRRRAAGDTSGGLISVGAGRSQLTYIEAAAVDALICRRASWFVGWTSSSFTATVARLRHLDHPTDRYYAYCSAPTLRGNGSLAVAPPADLIRLHTCRPNKHRGSDGFGAADAESTTSTDAPPLPTVFADAGGARTTLVAEQPLHPAASPPEGEASEDVTGDELRTAALAQMLEIAATREETRIAKLFARFRCRHVYLDVGTNVGVQIRKLYEPHKYPKAAATHGVFTRYFGPHGAARCGVCAIGVEPNPHHRTKLANLQRRYRAAGAGVLVLHAAASDADGIARLSLGHATKKDAWEDLGASASEAWTGLRKAGNPKELTVPVRAPEDYHTVHELPTACVHSSSHCGMCVQIVCAPGPRD